MSLNQHLSDAPTDLDPVQLTSPRDPIPPPSVLDVLRQCRPSRELHGILVRELQAAVDRGNLDDAAALFALAMCVREVIV
jgi:hypothetical protein